MKVPSGPSIAPFHIDGARIGGSKASQRHGFGMASGSPSAKPKWIPAPPKRDLGAGTPAAIELSQAQVKGIQDSVRPIIEALQYELEAIKIESDWVSASTLRVEPDLYKSISDIGPYFTPQQVRSQIVVDSSEIANVASRILQGAVGSYLPADQKASLETVVSDANALRNYVQQFDMQSITGAATRLSQDHTESHKGKILESIEEVERGIVSNEAGSVPVIEPMERGGIGIGGLVAVGALIAVGIIIADLI